MRYKHSSWARGYQGSLNGTLLLTQAQVLQYRGAKYVLAQEPLEAVDRYLTAWADGVKQHAQGLFKKAGIKYKAGPELAASGQGDQKDGIELKYNLQAGNFTGIEADLYIDYLLKGKNVLGEEAGWWESAVSWADEFLKSKEEQEIDAAGDYKVNQMVFRFCRGNHASTPDQSPKLAQMLETIAFLQGAGDQVVVKPTREEGKELSEDERTASDQVIKVMNALKAKFQGKKFPGYHGDKNYPAAGDGAWGKSDLWVELLGELSGNAAVPAVTAEQLVQAIQQLEADGALVDTIKNLERLAKRPPAPQTMTGPGGVREVFKTKLATIINQGAYRINYTAWDKMGITSDDDGNVILKLAAPMKPYFTFEKSKGGPPKLLEASCRLCGHVFASQRGDEVAASKLAWTGVVLGRGAALGINPVEAEHQLEESWLADLMMNLPTAEKLPEGDKLKTEAPPAEGEGGPAAPAAEPAGASEPEKAKR